MPNIDFNQETYEKLKNLAEKDNRSMRRQAHHLIEIAWKEVFAGEPD